MRLHSKESAMTLTRYRLGDLIRLREERNVALQYGTDDVRGVNNLKKLINTKANLDGRDLSKFQIVEPGTFFFNHRTSRNGSKISITYNYEKNPIIVTEDYVLFDCIDIDIIDPTWLYMYMSRSEFDRYAIMNSWGSSTEFFNWEDMCDVEIELPPIEVQRKYVAIYEAMCENQRCYETGLEDLKLACDVELEHIRDTESNWISLYELINETDVRNSNLECDRPYGVTMGKDIILSNANTTNLHLYKLIKPGEIACNLLHVGRDKAYPIAKNETGQPLAVSQSYLTFETKEIDSDYLLAWFSREETGRYGWFLGDDNIRSSISLERFLDIKIPVPDKKIQKSISLILRTYRKRKKIDEKLKQQIRDLCPILIKGSLEEASKA